MNYINTALASVCGHICAFGSVKHTETGLGDQMVGNDRVRVVLSESSTVSAHNLE